MQQMPLGKRTDIDWSTPGQPAWPPRATRAQGLQQLDAFICKAGRAYQTHRNSDLGSGRHGHVSLLSPYLRHRLIDESEVISKVLGQHSQTEALNLSRRCSGAPIGRGGWSSDDYFGPNISSSSRLCLSSNYKPADKVLITLLHKRSDTDPII